MFMLSLHIYMKKILCILLDNLIEKWNLVRNPDYYLDAVYKLKIAGA